MSDFVNEFWNWYVILIVLISIVACAVFLWVQSRARPGTAQTTDTTGHVWDETLEEYKPHNPAALAEEASLRAALSGDPRSLMTVSDGMHRRGSCDANFASAGREGGAA